MSALPKQMNTAKKIAEAKLPRGGGKKAFKELERLEKIPPAAAGAVVIETYLDWLIELPWSVQTEDQLDLKIVETILDEDHYGLEKVKERILEYLAVRSLARKNKRTYHLFDRPSGCREDTPLHVL